MTNNPSELREAVSLLPCPFCGGAAHWPEPEVNITYVGCKECTACVPNEVIWNTRAPQVAGGDWVMVPREPTAAMLRAGVGQWLGRGAPSFSAGWQAYVLKTWNTMLAAAPTASAAEGGEKPSDNAFEHHGEGGPSADNWIKFLEVNGYASPAVFDRLRAVSKAREAERNRIVDHIEQAIYEADDKATVDALVGLAAKVLIP